MRGRSATWSAIILAAGCAYLAASPLPAARASGGTPPGPSTVRPVLRWEVSQGLWGTLRMEVSRVGVVTYHFVPVRRDKVEEKAQQTLTPRQMRELYAALRDAGACYRKGKRKLGIPDEGRPTLTLHWQKLRCSVTMWDGEWFEDHKARAIAHAIRKLIQKTKAAAKLP